MKLQTAPVLDTRPCPADANECVIVALNDELDRRGFDAVKYQASADKLQATATGALWDGATLWEAARIAVHVHKERLIRKGEAG